MPERKLLIQSYKFPPVQVVGAQRLYHLCASAREWFDQVHVITTANRRLFPQDASLAIDDLPVYEVPTNDLRTWLLRRGRVGAYLTKEDQQFFDFPALRHLYHSFPFVRYFGDGGYGYIRRSYRQAVRLVREEGITHILTSYRPWSDHLVAHRLKRRFPHLVWIADFRDFPVDPVRQDVWWPAHQRLMMRRLLRRVDVLTTVSDGVARHFAPYHDRVVVVRNGLPALPGGFPSAPADVRFTISYTGSIYPHLQSADLLLGCLRELLNAGQINPVHLELRYAGKDSEVWHGWLRRHGLSHLNRDYGLLPLREAQALQRASQLNLLLSWSAPGYGGIMTAKLAHYLASGRPIITVLAGPADPELSRLIEQTGAGFVYPTAEPQSGEQLANFILDAYRSWAFSGALPWQTSPTALQPYTWPAQMDHLWQVLAPDAVSAEMNF
ncbi:MAG: hypothetical protein KDC54_11700 [Lewinella sp.]|nr:hypothetical protein [Lewinella sp.]